MSTVVQHGSYGWESRFDVTQHEYVGASCEASTQGFFELLEVANPPKGCSGFIIHAFWHGVGSTHFEFSSLSLARTAYGAIRNSLTPSQMDKAEALAYQKYGCTGVGKTPNARPWFYNP